MRRRPKHFLTALLILVTLLACAKASRAQDNCLSSDEIMKMQAQIKSAPNVTFNKKLHDDLMKLWKKDHDRVQDAVSDRKPDNVLDRLRESRSKAPDHLCEILKEFGWPTKKLVGEDGAAAAFLLLRNTSNPTMQAALLPVIIAATSAGEIRLSDFAFYIDRLRLTAGLKQLFGTQATIRDGFLVMFPIENETLVDARRKQYQLPPLAEYQRTLEQNYRLPLIKATGEITNLFSANEKRSIDKATTVSLIPGQEMEEGDVLRVETNLVSLYVSAFSTRLQTHVATLEQKDFVVTEDGAPQTVNFFAATDVPFDLVLLLDLSGSTSGKRNLIRKTTQHFIEAARPADRLAIVTFTDRPTVVSPLTTDRTKLIAAAREIDGDGASYVWDALKFTLDQVLGPKPADRRRAVVFMTDGADNALSGWSIGSSISFADLLEAVRHNDALIIPIYLDTEGDNPFAARIYANARRTLNLLADETGGLYYKARKIEDLNGIYDQVIQDLGKVYSLGYKPTNTTHDNTWREVVVSIVNRTDLVARTRPGYYAQ